jgi:hypothetical protein
MAYNYNYVAENTGNATGEANDTQYADKPITGGKKVTVINETVIRQVQRSKLEIENWRNAHQVAESRYFPNRSWLYNIYDDILLDLHLSGIIQKRIETVLNKSMYFAVKETPVAEMDKLLSSVKFRMVKKQIIESMLWGLSGIEFEPGKEFAPKIINRKHIKPKWQRVVFEEYGTTGVDYTTADNIWIIGEPEDLGLLLKCAPYVIYKRNNTGDWAQYIEIFGQPIRVMYYDAYDQQAKLELKQTLDDSGGSMALMIPKGVEFDIKDGKVTNGDGQLQDTFKDFLNAEMSIAILGNTETTTHNGQTGTGGKSKVHSQQQNEILKSDIAYLTAYLNSDQFLKILADYGYPVEGGCFMFNQEINIEQQAEQIDIDDKLQNKLGMPLDHDQLYKYYGRNKPADYEARIAEIKASRDALNASDETEPNPDDPKPTGKKKPNAKALKAHNPTAQRKLSHSKLRNLYTAITDFFAQALH